MGMYLSAMAVIGAMFFVALGQEPAKGFKSKSLATILNIEVIE